MSTTKTQKQRRAYTPLYTEEVQLLTGQKETNIQYCEQSQRVYFQKRWIKKDLKSHIIQTIKKNLIFAKDCEITKVDIDIADVYSKQAIITVSGKKDTLTYHQSYDATYALIPQTSPYVSKLNETYMEGVIQLRNIKDSDCTYIKTQLRDMSQKGLGVTKEKKVQNGYDFTINNKKLASSFMNKMRSHIGGILKKDAKHFSENKQEGKIIYRTNFTLISFLFAKYDIIQFESQYYVVLQIDKTAKIQDLFSKKSRVLTVDEAKTVEIVKPQLAHITRRTPSLHVIHPKTYEEVPIQYATTKEKISQKQKELLVVPVLETVFYTPSLESNNI